MTATEEDVKQKRNKPTLSESDIINEVYRQKGKPENIIKAAAINVFENRYRVNIWQSLNNILLPKAGKIVASYFVIVTNNFEVKVLD
jgi:uncharacterized protein (UPF0333 family)